jgi:hypothetical protein
MLALGCQRHRPFELAAQSEAVKRSREARGDPIGPVRKGSRHPQRLAARRPPQNPSRSTKIPGKIANAIVIGRMRKTSGMVPGLEHALRGYASRYEQPTTGDDELHSDTHTPSRSHASSSARKQTWGINSGSVGTPAKVPQDNCLLRRVQKIPLRFRIRGVLSEWKLPCTYPDCVGDTGYGSRTICQRGHHSHSLISVKAIRNINRIPNPRSVALVDPLLGRKCLAYLPLVGNNTTTLGIIKKLRLGLSNRGFCGGRSGSANDNGRRGDCWRGRRGIRRL